MEIILGAAVSIVVQIIKQVAGTKKWITLLIVLILSLIAAIVYSILSVSVVWDKILPILITAGAVHNFIIRQFETK